MSYYDPQAWQLPGQIRGDMRESSWDQSQGPSRSDAGSAMQGGEGGAFHSQIEDVDRAIDNLAKSGKLFNQPGRRDSMPMMGGPESFSNFQSPRMGGMGGGRHHSVDYSDQMRPQSGSGLQNFYANQRHQPRPTETEQMMQAKRRMAAQRERELRNYHQEQQYNRNVSTKGGTSDRAISPNTINEEDRRELIARQHRALYGNENSPYNETNSGFADNGHTPRPSYPPSGSTSATAGRGPSPRTYDPFSMGQNQSQPNMNEQNSQFSPNEQNNQQSGGKGPSPNPQQQRPRADSTSSPASNPPGQNFPLFESAAQQSSRTSTSSPGGSPPRQAGKTSAPGVAPIGTRPNQPQSNNLAPNKHTGTPSLSPLGNSSSFENNERSTSAASNPTGNSNKDSNVSSWGQASSGPWGSNSNTSKPLGVQASVWG